MRPRTTCTLPMAGALFVAGCSPYAVISRADQPPLEARVVSGAARTITVETAAGETLVLARDDIAEIDHPGNVAMALGLPNTVLGTLFGVITIFMMPAAIEQGWPENTGERLGAAPVALGFGLFAAVNLGIGLPPFIWGSDMWFTSTGNAQPAYDTPLQSRIRIGPGAIRVAF